jgi:hypothetical protein
VPQIEVSEQQIVDALNGCRPRDAARLSGDLSPGGLDRTIDALQPRIVEISRQRGLDWTKLPDEERERLDEVLHE